MTGTTPLLELVHVSKRYPGVEASEVLSDVQLQVAPGDTLAITGPSGSGKTTLLNIVGGLDRPTAGQVLLDGKDLTTLNDDELAAVRNRNIGFVFQLHHLLPHCTALENVLVPTLANQTGSVGSQMHERAKQLFERVGLQDRMSYQPGRLSGGERQRVAIIRALINHPKLLLADEPTGSLDRQAADNFLEILVELNHQEQVSLIIATHATSLASRMQSIFTLCDGKLQPQRCPA